MSRSRNVIELSERSREIFREIVDTYVETGEPVGSRTLSRRLSSALSPATARCDCWVASFCQSAGIG